MRACAFVELCKAEALSYGFLLCPQRICGGVGECVCEECRCQKGYKGEHCEICDINVIEVSPVHLLHHLLKPLNAPPHLRAV